MAVEEVTVTSAGPDSARVLGRQNSHCSRCSLKSGCGHQLLMTSANSKSRQELTLEFPLPSALYGKVEKGDTLVLTIDEPGLVSLSLLQYVVPLIGLLAGTAIAGVLTDPAAGEQVTILSAIVGMIAGLVVVRKITLGMVMPAALALPKTREEEIILNSEKQIRDS